MSLDPNQNGCTTVNFLSRATDFTRMVVSDDNIQQFLDGLKTFPKNDQLWIKAHDYFQKQSVQAGYNVIARAYAQNSGDKEITERLAESSIAMGAIYAGAGEYGTADAYFEDAERIYFDLSLAFDWHTMVGPLQKLYVAWGREENAECCANALQEPFDVKAIQFLVEQRKILDINQTKNAIHARVSGLPEVDALVPVQR